MTTGRLLNLLEDRRMLWKDFSLEFEEHCYQSAGLARRQIGDLLDNLETGAALAAKLKAIQRAFRDFMDDAGDDKPWGRRYSGTGGPTACRSRSEPSAVSSACRSESSPPCMTSRCRVSWQRLSPTGRGGSSKGFYPPTDRSLTTTSAASSPPPPVPPPAAPGSAASGSVLRVPERPCRCGGHQPGQRRLLD
jgi:hypothetical protein